MNVMLVFKRTFRSSRAKCWSRALHVSITCGEFEQFALLLFQEAVLITTLQIEFMPNGLKGTRAILCAVH